MIGKHFTITFFSIYILLFVGCRNKEYGDDRKVIQRDGEPDMVETSGEELMFRAREEAIRTLPDFAKALEEQNPACTDFGIKKAYALDSEGNKEHIWCINVSKTADGYIGEINNEPYYADVELGEIVDIKPEEISDWMYYENDELRGGYSIVALAYGTPKQEEFQRMMNIDWSRYPFLYE